jgi:uncharacterized protein YciI
MQFMIVAYDGLDEGALNRRLAARESHIAGAIALKKAGHLIAGGAILDDAERMIGSTIYVDFASRADLDDWLQQDPYVIGDVWRDITISPIRLTV